MLRSCIASSGKSGGLMKEQDLHVIGGIEASERCINMIGYVLTSLKHAIQILVPVIDHKAACVSALRASLDFWRTTKREQDLSATFVR